MPDYWPDIEADFLAIYHQVDYSEFEDDGPKFLRLAARLPLYEGAVRKRIEIKMQEEKEESEKPFRQSNNDDYDEVPKTMSMREAVARSKGTDDDVLTALNEDASKSPYGALFEHTKVASG